MTRRLEHHSSSDHLPTISPHTNTGDQQSHTALHQQTVHQTTPTFNRDDFDGQLALEHQSVNTFTPQEHPDPLRFRGMARFSGGLDSSEGETPELSPSQTPECTEKAVKRRVSRAGTRSVSTLTPAQLSRKRANDREAQRAIRQRTKEHIEKLELRIAELESCGAGDHGPNTKLDEVLMRNAILETQVVQLARQLQLSCSPLGYGAQKHYDQSDMSAVSQWQSNTMGSVSDSVDNCESMTSSGFINPGMASSSYSPTSIHMPPTPNTTSPFIDTSVGSGMCSVSVGTPNDIGSPSDWTTLSTRMDQTNNCQSIPRSIPTFPISPVSAGSSPTFRQPPMYSWEIPTKLTPATNPVDGLLFNLIQTQRAMGMSGMSRSQLVGPTHPNLKSLIYDDAETQSLMHPISRCTFDVICNSYELRLPVRTAAFFLLYRLLQWEISPSPESYNNLPEWFQPRPSQNITPHCAWVDAVIFPQLREKIIDNQDLYENEEFQHLYCSAVNVNWPYRDLDVLEVVDDGSSGGGELRISEQFRRHIWNLGNWSLDPIFSRRYPELADLCRITDVVKTEGAMNGS